MGDQNFHTFMSSKHASNKLHTDALQNDKSLLDSSALLDTTSVRSNERWTASQQYSANLLDSSALLDTRAILSDEKWQESKRYETQLTDSSALLDNRKLLDTGKLLDAPFTPPLTFWIKHRFGIPTTTHIHDLTAYLASEPSLALPNPFDTLLEAPIPESFHVALRLLASGKTSTPAPHPSLIAGPKNIFTPKYRLAVPASGSLAIGEGTGDVKVAECKYPMQSRGKTRIMIENRDSGAIPEANEIVMRNIGWGRNEYFELNGVRFEWRYDGHWWNSRRMTLYRILEDNIGENGGELVTEKMSRKERKRKRKEEKRAKREVVGRYFEGRSCKSGGTFVMVDEKGLEGEGGLDRVLGVATCLAILKKRRIREAEQNSGG
ncbi:hypothetical protein MMC30_006552 [Trapelia coarctata]|nr:hypothetical protein [Trapelia coarctata]